MLDDQIYDYLQGFVALTGLVDTRVWPDVLKEGASMPAVVWQSVSDLPTYSQTADSGLDDGLYQFAAWGKTPLQARQVADQLRKCFGGTKVTLPDGTKFDAFVENMRRSDDSLTGLFRVILDIRFLHT